MAVSKAAIRREKMAAFNARVDAEKGRLAGLDLTLPELVDLLHSESFYTDLAAMHHIRLRRDRDPEAVMAAMLAGLEHPKWKVRRTCADYMDHEGDARCAAPLVRALGDPKEAVRRLALHALTCQPCKVRPLEGDRVPHLITRATGDRSARVRRIATGSLGDFLDDPRAVAALERLAGGDHDAVVSSRARAALERRCGPVAGRGQDGCARESPRRSGDSQE